MGQPGTMRRFAIILTLLPALAAAPDIYFSLTLTIYSLPRYRIWTYRLVPDEISVTRHGTNGGRDAVVYRRDLSIKERRSFMKLFRRFPLDRLESHYIDEKNRGATFSSYHFQIQKSSRDIYVYYARPGELLDLNRAINRLLPRQYHLWSEGE